VARCTRPFGFFSHESEGGEEARRREGEEKRRRGEEKARRELHCLYTACEYRVSTNQQE
jgi:hypothetical protein